MRYANVFSMYELHQSRLQCFETNTLSSSSSKRNLVGNVSKVTIRSVGCTCSAVEWSLPLEWDLTFRRFLPDQILPVRDEHFLVHYGDLLFCELVWVQCDELSRNSLPRSTSCWGESFDLLFPAIVRIWCGGAGHLLLPLRVGCRCSVSCFIIGHPSWSWSLKAVSFINQVFCYPGYNWRFVSSIDSTLI